MDKRIERILYLRDECDHCIMDAEFVQECSQIFGCPLKTHVIHESLLYPDSTSNIGAGADAIAESLCRHFKIPYRVTIGRGTQLRECCASLLTFFSSPQAPPPPKEPAANVWPGSLRSQTKKCVDQ